MLDAAFLGLGHLVAAGIAFLAGALRDADHGRQRAFDDLVTLVGGAFGDDAIAGAVNVQLAHVADVGQAHQLGHLRANLAGLGVAAVAAAHDQVRRLALEGQRQGLGGGQGVAAGQGAVGEEDAAVGAQGVALGQALGGVGRAHGQRNDGVI